MKQSVLTTGIGAVLQINSVDGDLQVIGWDRNEIIAKSDDDDLNLTMDGQNIQVICEGDLVIYMHRDTGLKIHSVDGDAELRALPGSSIDILSVGGDLQMRDVFKVNLKTVGGDLSVRDCYGDFTANSVGGDASLHHIFGNVKLTVGADLYIRDCDQNVTAEAGSDAALYLCPAPEKSVSVIAGSDILLRLPVNANVDLSLQGSDDESIRVDLPGVEPGEIGMMRKVRAGSGGASIFLQAGDEVIVTNREEEWDNLADFDPLGREAPYSPGVFPGLPSDLHDRISREVEEAARQAERAAAQAQEISGRVQTRVENAMRRAEEKMRSSERRTMHMGMKIGRWGAEFDTSKPIPPIPPRPVTEPVTDSERLAILKMLQDKKISMQEAEQLLSALEGK